MFSRNGRCFQRACLWPQDVCEFRDCCCCYQLVWCTFSFFFIVVDILTFRPLTASNRWSRWCWSICVGCSRTIDGKHHCLRRSDRHCSRRWRYQHQHPEAHWCWVFCFCQHPHGLPWIRDGVDFCLKENVRRLNFFSFFLSLLFLLFYNSIRFAAGDVIRASKKSVSLTNAFCTWFVTRYHPTLYSTMCIVDVCKYKGWLDLESFLLL